MSNSCALLQVPLLKLIKKRFVSMCWISSGVSMTLVWMIGVVGILNEFPQKLFLESRVCVSEANAILLAGEYLFHELFRTGLRSKCQTTKLYCCIIPSASFVWQAICYPSESVCFPKFGICWHNWHFPSIGNESRDRKILSILEQIIWISLSWWFWCI